jgi:hypothetical protein
MEETVLTEVRQLSQWQYSNGMSLKSMHHDLNVHLLRQRSMAIFEWDVSSVINMSNMLYGAAMFNGDISEWDVSKCRQHGFCVFELQRLMAIFPNGMSLCHNKEPFDGAICSMAIFPNGTSLPSRSICSMSQRSMRYFQMGSLLSTSSSCSMSSSVQWWYFGMGIFRQHRIMSEGATASMAIFPNGRLFQIKLWLIFRRSCIATWYLNGMSLHHQYEFIYVCRTASMAIFPNGMSLPSPGWSMFDGATAFNVDISEWNVLLSTVRISCSTGRRLEQRWDLDEWIETDPMFDGSSGGLIRNV